MPAAWYELIARALRYVFAGLGLLFVLQGIRALRAGRRVRTELLRRLPDPGCIGELVVAQAAGELEAEMTLPVPWEGTLGSVRTCDVVTPAPGIAARHATLIFREGEGLTVTPCRGCSLSVDGEEITDAAAAQAHPLRHGSVLTVGALEMHLRVFAGVDVPHAAAFHAEAPAEESFPEAPYPPVPQGEPVVIHTGPIQVVQPGTAAPNPIVPAAPIVSPTPPAARELPTAPVPLVPPAPLVPVNDSPAVHRRIRRRHGEEKA